jgi:Acyl-coenzyme A:6-aminopenicillanic acid acyl-transferase
VSVNLTERELGGLRWIRLEGPAAEAFAALGEHARADIGAVLSDWDGLAELRRHAAAEPGRGWLAAAATASQAQCPGPWSELAAMAAGAGAPMDDLVLLNCRGDMGAAPPDGRPPDGRPPDGRPPGADDGAGCSDLAWRRERSFIAHNEDDAAFFEGRCALLTLALDGQPAVTAFWKPGFLPSNTIAVTESGLTWSIDHLTVAAPAAGRPGRHFVARGLPAAAQTAGQALGYLREHPAAGGFSYTIGDRTGRVVIAESVAGRFAWHEVGGGADGPLGWHTNHGRFVTGAEGDAYGTSLTRGAVLESLTEPAAEPDAAWFTAILTGAVPPLGVRAEPGPASTAATLCTFVADLSGHLFHSLVRGRQPVTIPLSDLLS